MQETLPLLDDEELFGQPEIEFEPASVRRIGEIAMQAVGEGE